MTIVIGATAKELTLSLSNHIVEYIKREWLDNKNKCVEFYDIYGKKYLIRVNAINYIIQY